MNKLLVVFISCACAAFCSAQNVDSTNTPPASLTNDNILYVNVSNPILHGKAGLAYSIRRRAMDYFFYSNYIYGQGLISNTIYFTEGQYGIPDKDQDYERFSGCDIGIQFRFRNPILSKPYLNYIKDAAKYTSFYTGLSIEVSYVHVENRKLISSRNYYSDAWMWNPKFGMLFGWTLTAKRVYFDLNLNLMFGWSSIKIYDVPRYNYFGPDDYSFVNLEANPMIFKYEFSFLVGYKL